MDNNLSQSFDPRAIAQARIEKRRQNWQKKVEDTVFRNSISSDISKLYTGSTTRTPLKYPVQDRPSPPQLDFYDPTTNSLYIADDDNAILLPGSSTTNKELSNLTKSAVRLTQLIGNLEYDIGRFFSPVATTREKEHPPNTTSEKQHSLKEKTLAVNIETETQEPNFSPMGTATATATNEGTESFENDIFTVPLQETQEQVKGNYSSISLEKNHPVVMNGNINSISIHDISHHEMKKEIEHEQTSIPSAPFQDEFEQKGNEDKELSLSSPSSSTVSSSSSSSPSSLKREFKLKQQEMFGLEEKILHQKLQRLDGKRLALEQKMQKLHPNKAMYTITNARLVDDHVPEPSAPVVSKEMDRILRQESLTQEHQDLLKELIPFNSEITKNTIQTSLSRPRSNTLDPKFKPRSPKKNYNVGSIPPFITADEKKSKQILHQKPPQPQKNSQQIIQQQTTLRQQNIPQQKPIQQQQVPEHQTIQHQAGSSSQQKPMQQTQQTIPTYHPPNLPISPSLLFNHNGMLKPNGIKTLRQNSSDDHLINSLLENIQIYSNDLQREKNKSRKLRGYLSSLVSEELRKKDRQIMLLEGKLRMTPHGKTGTDNLVHQLNFNTPTHDVLRRPPPSPTTPNPTPLPLSPFQLSPRTSYSPPDSKKTLLKELLATLHQKLKEDEKNLTGNRNELIQTYRKKVAQVLQRSKK